MSAKYIERTSATVKDLKPGVRVYAKDAVNTYVARIGFADDWAAYWGSSEWKLDLVADHGLKMSEDHAKKIFPVCEEAGLSYRL